MKKSILFIVVILTSMSFQESEQEAVLKTVNTFLRSIEIKDPDLLKEVLSETGTSRYWNVDTGAPGELDHRNFIKNLKSTESSMERIMESHVRVEGKQASVWGRYMSYKNDSLSHCGSEVFSLEKKGKSWMIMSIDYTIETKTCK